MAAIGTGHAALDEKESALGIDANDLEQLRRARDIAQLARHALARKHAARVLRHPDRARRVVRARVAVRRAIGAEVVALDRARKSLALRCARYIDQLPDGERVDADDVARLELRQFIDGNLEFL